MRNLFSLLLTRPSHNLGRLALVLTVNLALAASVHPAATVHSSARAAAMGGAHIGLAKGVDAPKYNPANLGLDGYQHTGLEVFSLGVAVENNSLTLDDYNRFTGAELSTADKQYLLDRVPTEGFGLVVDLRASVFSFACQNWALSFGGVGAAEVNLDKDIVDFLLNGNSYADTIDVTGSYANAVSYGEVGLSYGRPIYASGTRQMSVGVTVRYIKGLAYEKLVKLEGQISTEIDGFDGQGDLLIRTASGGQGYGFDFGAAMKFNNRYTAGLRVKNLISKITWTESTQEHGYIYSFDKAAFDSFDDPEVSDDYTIDIESFSTRLPVVLTGGLAKISGRFLWAADWTQGFEASPGTSTKPLFALGVEYALVSFLPVRTGFTVGGDRGTRFSFGSGLRFLGFHFDAALFTGTSLSVYSAKGLNVAVASGIQF